MIKKNIKFFIGAFFTALALIVGVRECKPAMATDAYKEKSNVYLQNEEDGIFIDFSDKYESADGKEFLYCELHDGYDYYSPYTAGFRINGQAVSGTTFSIESSNEDVIELEDSKLCVKDTYYGSFNNYISYTVKKPGESTITFRSGAYSKEIKLYAYYKNIAINSMDRLTYNTARLNLNRQALPGSSGYYVYKGKVVDGMILWKRLGYTKDNCYDTKVEWNSEDYYLVCPYVKLKDGSILGETRKSYKDYISSNKIYTYAAPEVKISDVKQSGNKKLNVKWTKNKEAASYTLYGSVNENGPFKKLFSSKNTNKTSYSFKKATVGECYYFKVLYKFPDGKKLYTDVKPVYVANKTKLKPGKRDISIKMSYDIGQYIGYCSDSDNIYYYKGKDGLHIVSYVNQELFDYRLKGSKAKLTKRIKFDENVNFGCFYKGIDDNFYVAIGYDNYDSNKSKTVVRVIKYNSSWKKLKTCNIKNEKGHMFGISLPFHSSGCRMEMSGNTLYLVSGKGMYNGHQANLDIQINTKTMKTEDDMSDYASHSFNAFVRFQNDSLFVLKHGDAHPRAVKLTRVLDYLRPGSSCIESNLIFKMVGDAEDSTGVNVCGMEIGDTNVLTVGTAFPHKYKICGKTGYDSDYKYNLYLTVTDKKTGKNKLVWLTRYNPKNSKTYVKEARMVKITNDRFAILYTTTTNEKDTLNYVVVNGEGKVVLKKTYKNITFNAASQPIIYKGAIVWADFEIKQKNKYDEWSGSYGYFYEYCPVLCQIPIIIEN